jgi:hypothetical protein
MSYDPSASSGSGGAWSFIETVTVSNQATVEMDLSGTHKMFMFHIDSLVPITDDRELWMRFSTDAGSTFLASTNYNWGTSGTRGAGTVEQKDAQAAAQMVLSGDSFATMGTGTIEALNGFVYIHNANQTTNAVCSTSEISMLDATGTQSGWQGGGALVANLDEVDAVQFLAQSGNLSTGRISLYGLNLS